MKPSRPPNPPEIVVRRRSIAATSAPSTDEAQTISPLAPLRKALREGIAAHWKDEHLRASYLLLLAMTSWLEEHSDPITRVQGAKDLTVITTRIGVDPDPINNVKEAWSAVPNHFKTQVVVVDVTTYLIDQLIKTSGSSDRDPWRLRHLHRGLDPKRDQTERERFAANAFELLTYQITSHIMSR